jgi:hypothetical protein
VFNDAGADVDFRVEGDTDANLLFVDASTDRVGIGTNAPTAKLDVVESVFANIPRFTRTTTAITDSNLSSQRVKTTTSLDMSDGFGTAITFAIQDSANVENDIASVGAVRSGADNSGSITFITANAGTSAERIRIDSSGNLLVGTTDPLPYTNNDSDGIALRADGNAQFSRASGACARFNRKTNDGEIVSFGKDGLTVGSIGSVSSLMFIRGPGFRGVRLTSEESGNNGFNLIDNGSSVRIFEPTLDNTYDLGAAGARLDDIFATNNVIQTSDRNEKQDFETLSEAETRVAVTAKGLMKKYRWKSAVAKKGDDARIHFGIIAQDLQAAFEAEGLDAGRYAMFIKGEWWEHEVEVPAVEAEEAVYETQTDEEGNEVQVLVFEAVEAKEAYTRTDTYHTEEEAPEGAVRKERMGIRYNELLAFIIAAL